MATAKIHLSVKRLAPGLHLTACGKARYRTSTPEAWEQTKQTQPQFVCRACSARGARRALMCGVIGCPNDRACAEHAAFNGAP